MKQKSAAVVLPRFGSPRQFRFTVPPHYSHAGQLDTFLSMIANKETAFCFDERMSSDHFNNVTHPLIPGKRYLVELIPILRSVSTEACMDHLENESALLVGAQGLSVLYQLESRQVKKGRHVLSLDSPDRLWRDEKGTARVPVMSNDQQIYLFDLSFWYATWTPSFELLCFKDAW